MNQVSKQAHPGSHPHQPGQLRSIALAALVHVLLLSFLWIGIRWQNKASPAEEVEVWDMTRRDAAPKPVIEPEPQIVEDKPKIPTPVKEEVEKEDPEIALAQEKKRKLAEKKKQEELQRELAEKLAEKKHKEEQLKLAEQKLAAEKQAKQAKEDADKKKLAAKDKEKSDKLFKDELARVAKQAAVAGSGGSGTSEKSTGNNRGDPSYLAKIAAKVRSNTNYGAMDNTAGNPTVEYAISLLPDGSLRGAIRKTKSSGNLGFDDAVAKGIEKSAPFPRDKSGEVPSSLVLVYRMKEE